MQYWNNPFNAIFCPIMLWAMLCGLAPITFVQMFAPLEEVYRPLFMTGTAILAVLCALAVFADIAPPFITKIEVKWRNKRDHLFVLPMAWEEVSVLSPVLSRVRPGVGKKKGEEEEEASHKLKLSPVSQPSKA